MRKYGIIIYSSLKLGYFFLQNYLSFSVPYQNTKSGKSRRPYFLAGPFSIKTSLGKIIV